MPQITLPDGSTRQYDQPVTVAGVAESIGPGLAKAALAGRVDGELVDTSYTIDTDVNLSIVTDRDADGVEVIRHSCAHLMAQAVQRLFPDAQVTIGPVIENGFFYDFSFERPFTPEDLAAIETTMEEIVKEDLQVERSILSREEAVQLFEKMGEKYKVEIIESIPGDEDLSFYRQVDFIALCRGPHVPSTGKFKAFKLTSVAGAYWRGDSNNVMLQRIYGTAFSTREALDAHLKMLEEAKKRDHRVLGRQLGLFHIDEEVGQGLILWTPRGAIIRSCLQEFISEHLTRQGYHQVFTPHIGKLDLYRTSGHFPYYQDSQYPPLVEKDMMARLANEGCSCGELSNMMAAGDIEGYMLKPMNCPHHIKIYSSQARSYRDLPLRLAEFGTVYRWEQSGEISGLTRVRGFTQDDAHLFVTEDQIANEVLGCIELVQVIFEALGMHDYRVRVGLRDPDSTKYVGDSEKWDLAEEACRAAASTLGVNWSEEPGEAAFYGPKIDFVVKDVIGREWQLGTVQVDYNLPERFELQYKGSDGEMHRPVMIHRAPFGSMERFCGVLIEHFAGRFPTWLAPTQIHVLTISEKQVGYGQEITSKLKAAGIRADLDDGDDTIGKKIRMHRKFQPAYMLILGDDEANNNTVSIRARNGDQRAGVAFDTFVDELLDEINSKRATPALVPPKEE